MVLVFFSVPVFSVPAHAGPPRTVVTPTALLLEARGVTATIDDRAERSAALDPILVAQIEIDPSGARETLKLYPKQPKKLNYLTALAAVHAEAGNIAETERIYAEIVVEDRSSRPAKLAAANALGQVAIAYANKRNIEEAFLTLERLKERTKQEPAAIVGTVTAKLADAQAKQGDVDGAVKTAASIVGDNPYPLMKIVGDLARTGKNKQVQGIVSRLDDGASQYAQWGIVQAKIQQDRPRDAQVTASAIKPGHAKASALLELATYHREHKAQPLALTLLQEAEASARSTVDNWAQVDILWRIAAATAMAGDAARAIYIAKSIEKDGPRSSAIFDIAQAQAKQGDYAGAFNTAGLLKKAPQANHYDMAIFAVLVEMVKADKGAEAKETLANFQDSDIRRPWLYSGIAMAQADLGNIKEARAVLALAETEGQRSARRKELLQLKDKIRLDPADETRLQQLGKIEVEIQPGLDAIARAYARKGDLNAAMTIAGELNDPAHRLDVIKEINRLHALSGRKEHTLRWARNLTSPSEKVFALAGIATALSQQAGKPKGNPHR
jgi:hypothetical protein